MSGRLLLIESGFQDPQLPVADDASEVLLGLQIGCGSPSQDHLSVLPVGDPPCSQKRDGFKNPITGDDMYETTIENLASKNRKLPEETWMAHNLWVTNRKPACEWTFLTALTAWRNGQPGPEVKINGPSVTVVWPDQQPETVSFDPDVPADIRIDVPAVRAHALATDPQVLPPTGEVETVELDGDVYRVAWLAREHFDGWLSRWAVERNSEVRVVDGRLRVRDLHPETGNVGTFWFRPELPENVLVRFRAQAVDSEDENAANLNLFLHARELDGWPVRFGRSGQYTLYHEIPNYIVTFVGGFRNGWSRARRDPGFNLLHQAGVRSEVGQEYSIAVAYQSGRLRYYLDGARIHDVEDPEPLPAGRFAIRTWNTDGWWDDVDFGQILPAGR